MFDLFSMSTCLILYGFLSYDFGTYLCLMLFNDCITLWENITTLNFSPTSFHRDITSLRTRRKFQRHLPEWSPGNAAQRQESQSHTTLDTDLLGDDWWMWLFARGVGYCAMWVYLLMGAEGVWKKLLSNLNDSFVCTIQFEYAIGH